jgi:tetratricopeptide (TPR) repeat protein
MDFRQYNKKVTYYIFAFVFAVALFIPAAYASNGQQPASQQHRIDFEHFELLRSTNRDSAHKYVERVIGDIDSLAVSMEVAKVYDFMAEYAETTLHSYSKSLEYRLQSARIYEDLNNKPCITRTNALLARIYLRNGDYHNAFSYSTKALEDALQLGDKTSEREAYLILEQVTYFYNNNIDMAMDYNRKVTDGYEGREQAHQTVRALNNRFNYSMTFEDILDLTLLAEALCKEYDFGDLLINIYLNASMQALSFEEYDVAVDYLERAKPLLTNFKEEGYYYSALGFYNLMVGDSSEAIVNLKHSIELLGQDDFDAKNVHSYFLLQDIYFNEGRYKEAYEALMAFAETYTRQHNTSNVVNLSKLINDMELAQAEERLKQHQRELQQTREYNKLLRHIHTAVICFVAAIAVLALLLWRMQRKNSRLNSIKAEQELRHKNEIIKIQQLQQYEEQTNMEQLSEELNRAANITDNREMRNELRHIIRRLQKSAGADSHWAEVEKTLANSNDAFFENLLKEYPNLTKNERKLCTLIHMNLSTKEISNITHQSIGSINVARSRLRQKFGLTDSDTSLIAFLDKFKG